MASTSGQRGGGGCRQPRAVHADEMAAWPRSIRDPQQHWKFYELAEKLVDLEDGVPLLAVPPRSTVERDHGFQARHRRHGGRKAICAGCWTSTCSRNSRRVRTALSFQPRRLHPLLSTSNREPRLTTGAQLAYVSAWSPTEGMVGQTDFRGKQSCSSNLKRKGCFRAALGGTRKTIPAGCWRTCGDEEPFLIWITAGGTPVRPAWSALRTRAAVAGVSISVSNEVFAVITNFNYISKRHERVP